MNQFYRLIKEVLPGISEQDLQLPVREGGIDSIDLLYIRTLLEKKVGELPDKVWNGFVTVQQAIDYSAAGEKGQGLLAEEPSCVKLARVQEINMPQMANGCLSEHWLFKELGDLHWALISEGLHTSSGALRDETGGRLYATFVRIQVIHPPLAAFAENERLQLEGSLKRFGIGTYISRVEGCCCGKKLEAALMTTFSAREDDNNNRLFKRSPQLEQNTVPEYVLTPEFLSDYRRARKGLLKCLEVDGTSFGVAGEVIYETVYDINPYYEINGVGLLYFAAYPIISDVCEARYFNKQLGNGTRWECRYSTQVRDVFYFSNCNRGERVIYQLNSYGYLDGGRIKLSSSLYRSSDRELMAQLFTVKAVRE